MDDLKEKLVAGFKKAMCNVTKFSQIDRKTTGDRALIIRRTVDDFTLTYMGGGAKTATFMNLTFRNLSESLDGDTHNELSKIFNDRYTVLEKQATEDNYKELTELSK